MSDYTKTTDFLSKDTLLSGDPNKTVLGAEIDTEFDNIATAIATKSDSAGTLAQFAATTSAQLAGVLSDETGSGAAVFANTPTLVTPVLGTPTSGTLTNCTGLPAAGVSGTAVVATGTVPMTGLFKTVKGADIASAATVDLGTATGNSVDVTHSTGTTAITSLGGASLQAGTEIETRFVISGGTLSLTHHATNLYLAGGVNITLANGDVIRWRKMHSSNAEWKMVGGVKADGTAWVVAAASGKIVQVVEGTPYTTYSSTATAMPADDSIPQNTEGAEWITASITPTSATNRLRIEATMGMVSGSGAIDLVAGLFQDSTANALTANVISSTGNFYVYPLSLSHEMAAGTTSSTTFKLRAGPASGTMYVNGKSSTRMLGGVSAVRLRITEIKV